MGIDSSTLRGRWTAARRLRRLGAATVALVALVAAGVGLATVGRPNLAGAAAVNPVFGTNMSLFDGNEQMIQNSQTQSLFRALGVPIIRMPFRQQLSDSIETQALQAIKSMGAAPLVIVHGAAVSGVGPLDAHLLTLVQGVFGTSTVYVEYGNEEDLSGVDQVAYTTSWNATVPALKAAHPTYKFIGPVNFQYNPGYIAYFVKNANPRPDLVSWHEYVCGPSDDTQAVCFGHLSRWATHVQLTNQAEQQAIGTTIPFFISEWNMDPQSDPRYTNASIIGPWTTQALQELTGLESQGLVGAMQYTAASHGGGFELLDSGNNWTAQGQAWVAALRGAPPPSPRPSPPRTSPTTSPSASPRPSPSARPSPSPRPSASPVPGPSPSPEPPQGGGGLAGWGVAWGGQILTVSSSARQLTLTVDGRGYSSIGSDSSHARAGGTVTFHVRVTKGATVTLSPWAMDQRYAVHMADDGRVVVGPAQSWQTVTFVVPAVGTVRAIGLQVDSSDGGGATLVIDSISEGR